MKTLLELFQAAGLPVTSSTEQGAIQYGEMTEEEHLLMREIAMEYFFPAKYAVYAEKKAIAAQARSEASLSGALATVTPVEAVAYIETHVVDLPSAIVALKLMARMLIALRDASWPELNI